MGEDSPTGIFTSSGGPRREPIFSMLVGESPNVASEGGTVIGFRGKPGRARRHGESSPTLVLERGQDRRSRRTAAGIRRGGRIPEAASFLFARTARLLASSESPGVVEAKRSIEGLYDGITVSARPSCSNSSGNFNCGLLLRQCRTPS